MKLKGKLSIYCAGDRPVEIEIEDELSSQSFCKITISHENFIAALGRLKCSHMDMEVYGLEKVGKKMIMKPFEFEMPKHDYKNQKEIAKKEVLKVCPKGWEADDWFSGQESFERRGNKVIAHTTIRKWETPLILHKENK